MTLVSAEPVREHVLKLRAAAGTYAAIGQAATTGAMTVHCIANARRPKVQAEIASRLLAVSQADIRSMHPPPGGIMWRLRALIAMGHTGGSSAAKCTPSDPSCGKRPSRCSTPGGTRRHRSGPARKNSPSATPSNAPRSTTGRPQPGSTKTNSTSRLPAAIRLAARPRHRRRRRLSTRPKKGRAS